MWLRIRNFLLAYICTTNVNLDILPWPASILRLACFGPTLYMFKNIIKILYKNKTECKLYFQFTSLLHQR